MRRLAQQIIHKI